MTDSMPALIAAEIDSYDQVLQRAIKAEQELAAAEAALGRVQVIAAEYLQSPARQPVSAFLSVVGRRLQAALDGES